MPYKDKGPLPDCGWGPIDKRKFCMWARYAFGLLLSAPLFQVGKAHAEFFTEGESVSYSESLTVEGFYHGLTGGDYVPGGEVSFTHNRGVLGYRSGNFEAGVIGRYDYSADYDPDAFEFLYKGINGQELNNICLC